MIQVARSANSQSFFRETEFCVLILEDMDTIKYFQDLIDDVVAKRKDPDVTYTGAKDLRRQMLAYLYQCGEVKTANVWCRLLIYDLFHINELRQLIADRLAAEGILGVVEIHLQDREINSPHIQFVGIKAERAEQIIAEIVFELNYERSVESALGRGIYPHYLSNPNAQTFSLEKELERELEIEMRKKLIAKIEAQDENFFEDMQRQRNEFVDMLNSEVNREVNRVRDEISQIQISTPRTEKPFYEKTNDEIIEYLNTRINNLRMNRIDIYRHDKKIGKIEPTPNFTPEFKEFKAKSKVLKDKSAEQILAFIYANLFNPAYRTKYLEYLKIGFPRVNFEVSESEFSAYEKLGQRLIDLHLLKNVPNDESIDFEGKFQSDDDFIIEALSANERYTQNTLRFNKNIAIKGITQDIYTFTIGGYEVIKQWLKYRKNYKASRSELEHLLNVAIIIKETLKIQAELEKLSSTQGKK